MLKKRIMALVAAIGLFASFASGTKAQTDEQHGPRQRQGVRPFTEEERNWFEIPQGRDLIPPSRREWGR